MKQCSLTAMFSRPAPPAVCANQYDIEDKERKASSSPDITVSSNCQDENFSIKTMEHSKEKLSISRGKKRLKLAKQDEDNPANMKTLAFSDANNVVMASVDKVDLISPSPPQSKELSKSHQKGETISSSEELMKPDKDIMSPSKNNLRSNNSKETMSYSDFLDMFQDPPCSVSNANDESKQEKSEKEADSESSNVKDCVKKSDITNCKSIASYFQPSGFKLAAQKTQKSSLVTITAEIHSFSNLEKKTSPKYALEEEIHISSSFEKSLRSCEIVSLEGKPSFKNDSDESEDIVLLSSEIIKDDSKGQTSKRRKSDGRKTKKHVEKKSTTNMKNNSAKQLTNDKILSPVVSNNITNDLSDEISSQPSSFQQSKISFGKFGLSICKTGLNNVIDSSPVREEEEEEIIVKKSTKKITKEPEVSDTCEEPQQVDSDVCNSKTINSNSNEGKGTKTDGMASSSNSSKVTNYASEKDDDSNHEKCENTLESNSPSEEQGQSDTTSTPGPRRSSRIKSSVQTKKETEVLEIGSDDEIVEVKKTRKSKQQPSHPDAQMKKVSVKPPGKLAPIFMKGKLVEEEPKQTEPAEDPEKVRARKEFLMSGIPDELRRIMAVTASAYAEADFPPLPRPSHVQQMSSVTLPHSDLTKFTLRQCLEENEMFDFSWSKLMWTTIKNDSDQISQAIPGPLVNESQSDMLLREMESFDPTFPFRETYNICVRRKIQDNASNPSDLDDIVIIDDDSPPVIKSVPLQPSNVVKDLLWCDVYQPCHSTEIVGNTKTIKQLKDWLTEWHNLMQKEVLKAAKGKKTQQRSNKTDSDWSADSDFTDSDDDDCRLCNTMLITGPHGIGKTSAVYGLAQEVGFKVFEVNASSLRSGKQLLSQLEEATQSHRVASNKISESAVKETPPAGTTKSEDQKPPTTKKSKKPPSGAAFATLFRKNNNSVTTSTKKEKLSDEKEKKKQSKADPSSKKSKRKAEDLEIKDLKAGSECTRSSRALNITSTSLILFDEADVVFEEDKGFLATVQHFMASTKIPIILTSTDPSLHLQLSPRHHHIVFKQPSLKSTIGFLYTVCLVNGVHTDWISLSNMVKTLKGDLRQCLIHLQFWCESGGGRNQIKESSSKDSFPPRHYSTIDQPGKNLFSVIKKESGGLDAQLYKPLRKRPRMIVDEDSNSSEASINISDQEFMQEKANTGSKSEKTSRLKRKRKEEPERNTMSQVKEKPGPKCPMIHYGCDASVLGENINSASTNVLVRFLKSTDDFTSQITSFPTHYASLRRFLDRDFIYSLALHCCGLPLTCLSPVNLEIHVEAQDKDSSKKRKRKRILSDCFDSEASDDEKEVDAKEKNVTENSVSTIQNDEECISCETGLPAKCAVTNNSDGLIKVDVASEDRDIEINVVNSNKDEGGEPQMEERSTDTGMFSVKVLSQFSKLYDNRSFVTLLEDTFGSEKSENSLKPGVEDQFSKKDCMDWRLDDSLQDIYACVDSLSARKFSSEVNECVKKYCESQSFKEASPQSSNSAWKEECELPIGTCPPDIWASSIHKDGSSRDQDPAVKNTKDCLGLWAHGSNAGIVTDYLPILREVCRFESDRQAANKKRRFHHYLDYIGFGLKESTIASLVSTYKVIASD